jgi:hypothetical protein
MSQPAAPANLNIRVFTQSGPISDIGPSPTVVRHALIPKLSLGLRGYLTGDRVERRLAAVLAAGAAGYCTRLVLMCDTHMGGGDLRRALPALVRPVGQDGKMGTAAL